MAKLRLQGEWKIWLSLGGIFVLVAIYLYLVSRPPMEGGEYLWRVIKIQDARNLSLKGSGNVIKFRLIGLQIPSSQEQAAREFVTKSLDDEWVRIKTIRELPDGVKEGFVYLSGEDMIARMIRQGLAKVDVDEKSIDVRPYIELEQESKREKRGLWRQ
jgi:endonuclease YncB( thermonuclease family)